MTTDSHDSIEYKQLFETANSPSDYSNTIYLFYIELAKITELEDQLVDKNLEHSGHKGIISKTPISYLLHASIQDIPNIVRDFSLNNIAVYQIVRLSKISSTLYDS